MKSELTKRFAMKDLGKAELCLGLEIHLDGSTSQLRLYKSKYVNGFLEFFSMSDSRTVNTPMEQINGMDPPLVDYFK